MERDANLWRWLGLTVLGGILIGLFTADNMFQAPAWGLVRVLLANEMTAGIFVLLAASFGVLGWHLFETRWRLAPSARGGMHPSLPVAPDVTALPHIALDLAHLRLEVDRELVYFPAAPIFSDTGRASARQRLNKLNAFGIPTPKLDGKSAKKELERLLSYIDTLQPALSAGNVALARREAQDWLAARRLEGHL